MEELIAIVIGAVVGLYLFAIVFTLGELVFGLILGFKFRYFSFLGLNILNENGKICIRKTNFTFMPFIAMAYGDNDGKDTNYAKDLIKSVLKTLMLIIAILLMYWCCRELSGIYYRVYGMAMAEMIIATIIVIIKYFEFVIKAYGKGPKSEIFREVRSVRSQLSQGVSPANLCFSGKIPNHKIFDNRELDYWGYDMIRYYWAIEKNQKSMMKTVFISEMEKQVAYDQKKSTRDPLRQCFYYELLYYYCAIEPDIQKAEQMMKYLGRNLENDKEINGRRVYAAYLYYTGKDKELALEVAKSGLSVYGKSLDKGLALFERDLINQLIEKIEGE